MSHSFKLTVAYDGTPFYGWQKTVAGPTIQGTLEETLSLILQEPIKIEGASRTDRGVHAKGQVASFSLSYAPPLEKIYISLCQLLPKEIALLALEKAPPHFHATLDAKEKTYCYHLTNNRFQMPQDRFYEWHLPAVIDLELLQKACIKLLGKRDFQALANKKKSESYANTIRELSLFSVEEEGGHFKFTLKGHRFLFRMARNLVGLAVAVGRKKIDLKELETILTQSKRELNPAMTAPAHGLTLAEVAY